MSAAPAGADKTGRMTVIDAEQNNRPPPGVVAKADRLRVAGLSLAAGPTGLDLERHAVARHAHLVERPGG